jgi:protein gp37
MAKRLKAMGAARYAEGFRTTVHEDLVDLPRRWRQPRTVFVNSMSDLFQESISFDFIRRVFETMAACPQHTFQVLTKRSGRLRQLAPRLPLPSNVWMGVSVENERVMHRMADLGAVPAAVRFLSCEPLIGPLEQLPLARIDWVIVGGESGPGARPMQKQWVHAIFRQCRAAQVPFFFKQWGGVRKDLTGRRLNGRTYDEMPQAANNRWQSAMPRAAWTESLLSSGMTACSLTSYRLRIFIDRTPRLATSASFPLSRE